MAAADFEDVGAVDPWLGPGAPEDELDRVEEALEAGDPARAYTLLTTEFSHRSGEPRFLWLLVWSALQTNRRGEAGAAADSLAAIRPDAESYLLLALCRLESARHAAGRDRRVALARALEAAQHSAELDPDSPHSLFLQIDAYLMAGQVKKAIALSDLTAAGFPDDPDTWFWRARVARAARDLATARAAVDFALELDPLHAPAAHERGAILAASGHSGDAMRQMLFADALDGSSNLSRQRMVSYGARCFFVLCLVATSPLAFVWPVWLVATAVAHQALFRSRWTGPTVQRWSYNIAVWMSRRTRPHLLGRRARSASPFRPIRQARVSDSMMLLSAILVSACGLAMTIDVLVRQTTDLWAVVASTDLVAIALTAVCRRRAHRDPGTLLTRSSAA